MGEQISWQVELYVKPDQLEAVRALSREMIDSTKSETGTLIYERFVSDNGEIVQVFERYIDSAAAVAHLNAFVGLYGDRLAKMVVRKRFAVFGTPSPELKEILDQFGATYFAPLAGFSRTGRE